ncbi:MAG TPA: hypothetical protein VM778_00915, partial [Gemmatimonadota bacterium]|nr:hypothetical protein [Gemmatimonadota bacterium]
AERGAGSAPVPDGTEAWPPLEALPAGALAAPPGTAAVLGAGGRPAAWLGERETRRVAIGLGTGWYRWPLAGGDPAAFWDAWSAALVRWLGAADSSRLPLVRLAGEGRLAPGEPLRAEVPGESSPPLRWRVSGERGEVAEGTAGPAGIRGPALPAGVYTLEAEDAAGRRGRARFVVETWAPDLAWTAADPEGLRRAAEPSGGALLGSGQLPSLAAPPARPAVPAAPGRGLGETPWSYLLAVALVLGDWALGARRRRG